MTFKDFVNECTAYEHSNEYFNILKECYELKLNSLYIKDQIFMRENAELIGSTGNLFTEGYLVESVDDMELEILLEKTGSKLNSIGNKIKSGWRKIVDMVIKFLNKLGASIDETNIAAKRLRNDISSIELTTSDINNIIDAINDTVNPSDDAFTPAKNQPSLKKLKLKCATGAVSNTNYSVLKTMLAAALTTKGAIADVSRTGDVNRVGALELKMVLRVLDGVSAAYKDGDYTKIERARNDMNISWRSVSKDGLFIPCDTSIINLHVKSLTAIRDTIFGGDDESNFFNDESTSEKSNKVDSAAKFADELRKLYAAMNISTAKSISIYSSYITYRSAIIKIVDQFIKQRSKNTK